MTEKTRHSDKGGGGSYWRFMAMVSTSTVIIFLASVPSCSPSPCGWCAVRPP